MDKFAAITFSNFDNLPDVEGLNETAGSIMMLIGPTSRYFSVDSEPHWREWIGTLRWGEVVDNTNLILFTHRPSQTPDVLDEENVRLTDDISMYYTTMPLVSPWWWSESVPSMLTGTCEVD